MNTSVDHVLFVLDSDSDKDDKEQSVLHTDVKPNHESKINIFHPIDYLVYENKHVVNANNRIMYFVSVKNILNMFDQKMIAFSALNRTINMDRLETQFNMFSIHSMDSIILSYMDGDEQLYVVDGQHRLTYIHKNRDQFNGNEIIVCDIRLIRNKQDYNNLFQFINNRWIVNKSDMNEIYLEEMKKILETKLSSIANNNGHKVFGKQRPHIHWTKLKNAIINTNTYKHSENKVKEVTSKLLHLNTLLSCDQFYDKKFLTKHTQIRKKTFTCGIFLAMDTSYRIISKIDDIHPTTQ